MIESGTVSSEGITPTSAGFVIATGVESEKCGGTPACKMRERVDSREELADEAEQEEERHRKSRLVEIPLHAIADANLGSAVHSLTFDRFERWEYC